MTPLAEILQEARAKLTPATWVQDAIAYTAFGVSVDADDEYAVRFCMVGAVQSILGSTGRMIDKAEATLDDAAQVLFSDRCQWTDKETDDAPAIMVNDHPDTTYEDVMRVYDEAIRLAS